MQIVSALFVENFALRQAPGPSTRIDLTGAFFSFAAPSPVPVTIDPHLVVLIYCPLTEPGNSLLEVIFRTGPPLKTSSWHETSALSPSSLESSPTDWSGVSCQSQTTDRFLPTVEWELGRGI